jgi:hypothetical protein
MLFNTWDRIEENEFADAVTASLQTLFPDDPPLFLRRTPHGYFDTDLIRSDLASAGFATPAQITTLAARSSARSPQIPASPTARELRYETRSPARGPSRLGEATDSAAEAVARRFGRGAVDGKIQAHVVSVES